MHMDAEPKPSFLVDFSIKCHISLSSSFGRGAVVSYEKYIFNFFKPENLIRTQLMP